mmetsp:Transcript_106337/g.305734  ORF Transcript_106337/g.305734 Transcript_106337/m.305734 type:complete len:273 (-) Transcript_106337:80-898(-)
MDAHVQLHPAGSEGLEVPGVVRFHVVAVQGQPGQGKESADRALVMAAAGAVVTDRRCAADGMGTTGHVKVLSLIQCPLADDVGLERMGELHLVPFNGAHIELIDNLLIFRRRLVIQLACVEESRTVDARCPLMDYLDERRYELAIVHLQQVHFVHKAAPMDLGNQARLVAAPSHVLQVHHASRLHGHAHRSPELFGRPRGEDALALVQCADAVPRVVEQRRLPPRREARALQDARGSPRPCAIRQVLKLRLCVSLGAAPDVEVDVARHGLES